MIKRHIKNFSRSMRPMKCSVILKKEKNMISMEKTGNMPNNSNRRDSRSSMRVVSGDKHLPAILKKGISPIFLNLYSEVVKGGPGGGKPNSAGRISRESFS